MGSLAFLETPNLVAEWCKDRGPRGPSWAAEAGGICLGMSITWGLGFRV